MSFLLQKCQIIWSSCTFLDEKKPVISYEFPIGFREHVPEGSQSALSCRAVRCQIVQFWCDLFWFSKSLKSYCFCVKTTKELVIFKEFIAHFRQINWTSKHKQVQNIKSLVKIELYNFFNGIRSFKRTITVAFVWIRLLWPKKSRSGNWPWWKSRNLVEKM